MSTLKGPEIWQKIFVKKLHEKYRQEVPSTKRFEKLIDKLGGSIVLDHAATRTPDRSLHEFLTRLGAAFGLEPKASYEFPEKHLTAIAMDLPDGSGFKWFSTLILYRELSDKLINAVEEDMERAPNKLSGKGMEWLQKLEQDKCLSKKEAESFCDLLVNEFFCRQGKPLKKETLELVIKESNELANALLMGPQFNHIAYLLNGLDIEEWYGCEIIQVLNDTMERAGFTMLPSIQGKPGGVLRQTSTMADRLSFKLDDKGKTVPVEHPAMFLEFIQRGPEQDTNGKTLFDKHGQIKRFQGFLATNTVKLYDSTKVS